TWHSECRIPKINVFKYKAMARYHRKLGQHQLFTKLTIDKILMPGETLEAPKPTRRRTKKATPAAEATVEAPTAETSDETPKEVTKDGA
ncbi:MAG: bL21 family ribosomal protein, partial [Dehalococcoidales bacterium]|nr:bL21 family ribosomal protein [Dehalococcoidales bacterium]